MERTKGKNGSYKDDTPSKVMFFLDPLVNFKKKTEAGGYAQISDCYVHIWCICYCFCIAGHSLGALVYLQTKLSTAATTRFSSAA